MKVSDLYPGIKKLEVTGRVHSLSDVVDGAGWTRQTAILEDSSGSIALQLWNEQVGTVGEGDTVKIENGYVKEYQGKKQLSTGKWGEIKVIGQAKVAEPAKSPELEQNILDALEYHWNQIGNIIKDLKK